MNSKVSKELSIHRLEQAKEDLVAAKALNVKYNISKKIYKSKC